MIEKIKDEIDKGELGKYEKIIQTVMTEEYTSFDVSAALLKLYMVENKLDGHKELDAVDFGGRPSHQSNQGTGSRGQSNSGASRIHINTGKRKGVSPRHILSALIEETGIEKRLVRKIDGYDKFTFVEGPGEYRDDVLEKLNGSRIKGTKIRAEIANPKKR